MTKKRWFSFWLACVLLHFPCIAQAEPSQCYGTTANGYLKNGVALPRQGNNFESYSYTANLIGRTYLHSSVKEILLNAYAQLEHTHPNTLFKYGETGFKTGGEFKPHKTHRNGLSVDFMVPVKNPEGKSVALPTHVFNKWGYDVEFDDKGNYQDLIIDYEAMAAHIVELHKEALKQGVDIWRVIFDPQLQPNLLATKHGSYLRKRIQFSAKRSWVRHDEHYHVDFKIPCLPL